MDTRSGQMASMLTLGIALEWLKEAELAENEKRDLRSAVETACRWFRMSPDEVPANPVALRRLFSGVPGGAVGVTKKRRANVKWGVGRLLNLLGVGSRSARLPAPTERWRQLIDTITDRYARALLARFGRFCSARGAEPENVSNTVAADFLIALERELRVGKPLRVHRETIRLWNRYASRAGTCSRPLLTLPSYSRKYVLPWEAFHPALLEDVERFLSRQATLDPFDLSGPDSALKPSSIATYRDRLLRFASCLVLAGTDASQLRSLDDLVKLDAVERGLRYLTYERGAKPLAGAVGTVLTTIAECYVRCPVEKVARISAIAGRLRGKKRTLSGKVRERLAPLKHEPNLARLFLLPTALTRSLLRKSEPTISDAQLFQRALALALLTVCPLRIGSLCSIRLDSHLSWSSGPLRGDLIIEFGEGELKGDEPASFPIPRDVANLIRAYCGRFRPLQDPRGSPFLFCGRDPGRPRDKGGFSTLLTRLVFDRLGLWVNPHLYRHVVHLVVLRRFPGAYAMVARVLTHRSIATTIQNYSHYDGELAMQAYQRLVEGIQGGGRCDDDPNPAVIACALEQDRNHDSR